NVKIMYFIVCVLPARGTQLAPSIQTSEPMPPDRTPSATSLPPSAGSVRLQVPQDREHAPVVVGVQRQIQLHEDRVDVLVDGLGGDDQLAGDRGVRPALRHEP